MINLKIEVDNLTKIKKLDLFFIVIENSLTKNYDFSINLLMKLNDSF
ncbi:protein of unknown function [Mycoplasma capricolum subsp. capripneumoniae]|nr:protein of unknown function [Mycoplasma capricolum subsp. capripneumoniae]